MQALGLDVAAPLRKDGLADGGNLDDMPLYLPRGEGDLERGSGALLGVGDTERECRLCWDEYGI